MVGDVLRAFRHKRKLSQQKVAIALHIPRSAVSKIENGHQKLSTDLLVRFAEFFNVPVKRLLG